MTLLPLTTRPLLLRFLVQPTPVPWSARQIQVWSTRVSLLLISRLMLARPMPAPPTRKKMSLREMGSRSWRAVAAGGADLDEDGGELRAGVDEEAGEDDAVGVCGGDGGVAVGGVQGGEAEAEDDGVGAGDAEGFVEVVDAGGEEEILAVGELRVDGGGGVAVGVGDVDVRRRG